MILERGNRQFSIQIKTTPSLYYFYSYHFTSIMMSKLTLQECKRPLFRRAFDLSFAVVYCRASGTADLLKSQGSPLFSLHVSKTYSSAPVMPSSNETTCLDPEKVKKAISTIPSLPLASSSKIPLKLTVLLTWILIAWPSCTAD